MPTTPYAKLLVSINGGATQDGGITASSGDTVQLSAESTVGWNSASRWEITGFPSGFALPAGWSSETDSAGHVVYYYFGNTTPPSFTLGAWGKYMLSLHVNGGGGQKTDQTTAISVGSPGGLKDLGHREGGQFGGATEGWAKDHRANLRIIESAVVASAAATPASTPNTIASRDANGDTHFDKVFIDGEGSGASTAQNGSLNLPSNGSIHGMSSGLETVIARILAGGIVEFGQDTGTQESGGDFAHQYRTAGEHRFYSGGTLIGTFNEENRPAIDLPLSDASVLAARKVIALLGDSNVAGFGALLDGAAGFRPTFQRILRDSGVWFRIVGGRGWGAPNGTGVTYGTFPNVEDYHDAPTMPICDWRHDGQTGRRLSQTVALTSVNTGTDTFTATGHTLSNGSPVVFTSTGSIPTIATVLPYYFATNVSGSTFQVAQYDGGSALDVTGAGSGAITVNEGLGEIASALFAAHDETCTDIIILGGTNDISSRVDAGDSAAQALATTQTRATAYYDAIQAARPNARKYLISLLPFVDGTASGASYATKNTAVTDFNTWLRDTVVPARGRLWTYVDASSAMTAPFFQSDGVHPTSRGYEIYGEAIARAVVAGTGGGATDERFPREFVRRPAQACVELRATTDRITIPQQASLNPGSNSFFYGIWFMPFDPAAGGTSVVIQHENPYTDGGMLVITGGQVRVYAKTPIPIPTSSYTAVLKKFRWHRFLVFHDATRQEVALFCNGRLVQRAYTTLTSVTSQDGFAIGAFAGLNSAPGLYQQFIMGHGASLSIENALRMAQRDYWLGEEPAGTTARYAISEGTGTTINGSVYNSTAGTLSGGTWVGSNRYPLPCAIGRVKPLYDQQVRTFTSAYTATYWELVKCDPSGAGFTVTLPTAVNRTGDRIVVKNTTSNTNAITLDGNGAETINGSATIDITTAYGSLTLESDGANWLTV